VTSHNFEETLKEEDKTFVSDVFSRMKENFCTASTIFSLSPLLFLIPFLFKLKFNFEKKPILSKSWFLKIIPVELQLNQVFLEI